MKACMMCNYQRAIEILEKLAVINPCYNYGDYVNKYRLKFKEIEEELR